MAAESYGKGKATLSGRERWQSSLFDDGVSETLRIERATSRWQPRRRDPLISTSCWRCPEQMMWTLAMLSDARDFWLTVRRFTMPDADDRQALPSQTSSKVNPLGRIHGVCYADLSAIRRGCNCNSTYSAWNVTRWRQAVVRNA